MSEKNKRPGKTVEHIIPATDKRAERKAKELLKRPHDIDEDWDDYDLTPEHCFKKSHRME